MGVAPQVISEYRAAFAEFAQKARQARALMCAVSPDWAAIDAALLDLERARVNYNHRRDILAQSLSTDAAPLPLASPLDASRVGEIAQLRWELAGKPEGTAEENWYRAEEIIRRANAA